MPRKSIEQLAIERVLLQDTRPPLVYTIGVLVTPETIIKADARKDHMHKEYVIEQEIYRRVGLDRGNEAFKKAREILKMVGAEHGS